MARVQVSELQQVNRRLGAETQGLRLQVGGTRRHNWNKKVNFDNQYMDVLQVDELRVRLEEHLASGTCTLLGHTPRT